MIYEQVFVNSVVLGCSLALLSIGLTLAFGVMHIVNFAHGAFYMLGAYGVVVFGQRLGLPFMLALPLSIAVMVLTAPIFHFLLFRQLYGKFMESLMMTVGLTLVLEGLTQVTMGPEHQIVSSYLGDVYRFAGIVITGERLVVVVAAIILLCAVYLLVTKTRIGLGIRAIEQDPEVAGAYGVNIDFVSMVVLALSLGLAAAAGGLMSPLIFIDPYIGGDAILLAFAVVILGGLGSITGSLIAALLLGATLSISQTFLSLDAGRLIFFALVGAVLLFKPTGLLGKAAH